MKILIDGNNVFRALGVSRRSDPPAEEGFLQRIERAAAERDWEVIVFFDGPERHLPRESGLLTVRYAQGKSADSLIERAVAENGRREPIIVVTQDRAEADLVRALGAWVWGPARLKEELTEGR